MLQLLLECPDASASGKSVTSTRACCGYNKKVRSNEVPVEKSLAVYDLPLLGGLCEPVIQALGSAARWQRTEIKDQKALTHQSDYKPYEREANRATELLRQ